MGLIGTGRTQALREGVTRAAAAGFLAGGLARLALGGIAGPWALLVEAVYLPLGAIAAAVLAGVLVNLVALPALRRAVPGNALPDAAYRVAAAGAGLAAFAAAFCRAPPLAA